MRTSIAFALSSTLLAVAAPCFAGDVCEQPQDLDKYAQLRRLSYDLRNKPPSIDEYDALDDVDAIPAATIQEYLESDDFRLAMRRYHEQMFWPNLDAVKIHNQTGEIALSKSEPAYRFAGAARGKAFRGGNGTDSCGDFENNDIDDEGRPNPSSFHYINKGQADQVIQEGWRYVHPYWSPSVQIKVCDFDAQETETSKVKGVEYGCNTVEGNGSTECGCGTGLKYCYSDQDHVDDIIRDSTREQLERAVDKVTVGHAAYTDLILSTHADENGPIANWKKYLASNTNYSGLWNVADPDEPLPALDFTQSDDWVDVDRGPMHAGVLTLPEYLLRFQTNRGRANRFRIAFTGQYFIPPAQLDPLPGCNPDANDLTDRCNCQYCHTTLEPLAAHWGRFTEAGTQLMTDTSFFPLVDDTCVDDTPNTFCARFYVTDSMAENKGSLLPFQYSKVHPEYVDIIDGGPRKLAQQIVDDGTFATSTTNQVFAFLMKRAPITDGSVFDEQKAIASLAKGFTTNHYDFAWLVQQVVTMRQYRRTR